MANLSYGNVESTATFEMSTALKALVNADTNDVKGFGFGVHLSGANTVDVGTAAGKSLFGVIIQTDARGLATVRFKGGIEDVHMAKIGGTPAFPAVGVGGLGVNEACKVVTLVSGRVAAVINTNDTSETCTLIL